MLGIGRHGPLGPVRHHGMDGDHARPEAGGPFEDPTRRRTPPGGRSDAQDLAIISAADGVGPVSLERLLEAVGSPHDILEIARGRDAIGRLVAATQDPGGDRRPTLTHRAAAELVAVANDPSPVLDALAQSGVVPVALGDEAYPELLRAIELPPRVLFVQGNLAALDIAPTVAIVGTRRPTELGRRHAARIAAAIARSGAAVISGLALGIDGSAHAAALEAGGTTVAVIGGGHDVLAPRAHDRLAAALLEGGGAIVSEHPPGTAPRTGTFPRRNRIISGMAGAIVVVEAPIRSGALITAAWALEQGRDVFLLPGDIDAPQSAGCLAWLRDFAGLARIVAGVPELLEDLGLAERAPTDALVEPSTGSMRPAARIGPGPTVDTLARDVPAQDDALLRAVASGMDTVDAIVAGTGLPVAAVLASLTSLEGRGYVVGDVGRYRPGPRSVRPE